MSCSVLTILFSILLWLARIVIWFSWINLIWVWIRSGTSSAMDGAPESFWPEWWPWLTDGLAGMSWVGRVGARLGVEVGRGEVLDIASVDWNSNTWVTVLSGSDCFSKGFLSSCWSASRESKEHLALLSEAPIPTAAFLCFYSHASSMNMCSAASLIAFLKNEGVESLVDSSETLSSFFFPFLL